MAYSPRIIPANAILMMKTAKWLSCTVCVLASCFGGHAQAGQIKTVFVIAFENHNWTQPGPQKNPGQIFCEPSDPARCHAPFINSLVTPGNPNAAQVSFADNYFNIPGIHDSGANYIWAEAGDNLGQKGAQADRDPFAKLGETNQNTGDSLSYYLCRAGKTWRAYQEDANIDIATNQPLRPLDYKVPLASPRPGHFSRGKNGYNGSSEYAYAAKHNPPVHFRTTNGGENPKNPQAKNYPPLQQLEIDLQNNTVADYNWITPDIYNDMHDPLPGGFTYNGKPWKGDDARIAQGDSFLSIIVPKIRASRAYQDEGVIIIWWDETEGKYRDDANHKLGEIVISPEAKGNAYPGHVRYTHSSDLLTMQEIFNVGPCLRDACNATDLSDLFRPGAIPGQIKKHLQKADTCR